MVSGAVPWDVPNILHWKLAPTLSRSDAFGEFKPRNNDIA